MNGARWIVVAIVSTGLLAGCTTTPTPATAPDALRPLVDLAAERLATADAVAASKWRTGGAITDPPREQAVVDAARAGATARGLDPDAVATLFRDQIEANKAVQYGLFSAWSADPATAPAAPPDLATIRPRLDALSVRLLDTLAATRAVRTGPACAAERDRAVATARVGDDLHRRGLDRALASACR